MHDAVDEERRSPSHLARSDAALHVAADAFGNGGSSAIPIEDVQLEPELARVAAQGVVRERLLAVEEHRVHLPEAALPSGRLRGGRRGEGVRMDIRERKVPEAEPNVSTAKRFDTLDLTERPARVRALVVAVLDDQRSGGRAAHMVDAVDDWRHRGRRWLVDALAHLPPPKPSMMFSLRRRSVGWRVGERGASASRERSWVRGFDNEIPAW